MSDKLKFIGKVTHACKGNFKVKLTRSGDRHNNQPIEVENQREIPCNPKGKLREQRIEILVGDEVEVEVSPHGTDRGVIVYRLRK